METDPSPLFDSGFLSKLEQLHLLSKRIFRGQQRAERRSHQTGSSLEFADYRNYTHGDDLRTIDWNIYGRLDRLFVKLFEEEQDLHIHFLIDTSASMRWTAPLSNSRTDTHATKFNQARRIAASLAYIGLANLDRVNLYYFDSDLRNDMGISRGKSQFHKVLDFLKRAPHRNSATRLLPSLRSFAQRVKRRGLVFVLSDLFDPTGYEEALSLLRFNQFEAHVVQILDPAELQPDLFGDLQLVDSETGLTFDVTSDRTLLEQYQSGIHAFLESVQAFCLRHQIGYAQALASVPFEDLVLRVLREKRLVKS